MFNKQFPRGMTQSQNQMFTGMRQPSQYMPIYPEMNYYTQNNEGFYDNRSMYSASTATSTSQAINQNLKKKILDDINSLLSGCIENLIPKLVDECADNIFAKISVELEKQSREIEEIRSHITGFDDMIGDKCNVNKTFTPLKNIKKAESNMTQINKVVRDQKQMVEEFQKKEELLLNLREQVEYLKEKIVSENDFNERVNTQIRDKNVDLLDMKRFIDQKVTSLSNSMKNVKKNEMSPMATPGAQFDQIINLIDKITEKSEKHSFQTLNYKNLNHKTIYSDVEIINKTPEIFKREEKKPPVRKGRKSSLTNNVDFIF
jgi:hypothetical protein